MSNIIVLDDAVYSKLEKNAERQGVTPQVWIERIVDQEFRLSDLPRFSDDERAEMNKYSKALDQRFTELMKKKYRRTMGLEER